MNVLLIQPEYKDSWACPPLGIGYLVSALEKNGHKVNFIDLTLEPFSDAEFKRFVLENKPDLIGISLMVRALPQTKRLVNCVKQVSNIPVVIGGAQPTVMPTFTLEYTQADFAIIGEGEETIIELIKGLSGKKDYNTIDGLAFDSGDGMYKINKPRQFIKNLDEISFPAFHLISPLKYKIHPALTPIKKTPIAPIITSRGCPYQCSFCGGPLMWRKTFRMRSAKNIVDEIEILMRNYRVRQIFLSDDNFTLVKSHVIDLCKEIINRKIDIPWCCPNGIRIDTIDEEILKWMKKAGCYLLAFGIESGNQEILNRTHKQLDLKHVQEIIKMANLHKFLTYGFFIIGLPGENLETIRQTIDFAKNLSLDRVWFNILVPYPGTEIFNTYARDKSYFEIDWENIDTATGMIATGIKYKDLEEVDLVYWQRRALREFYLSNPKALMSVISHISLGSIRTLIKTSFFKRLVHRKS